LVPARVRLVEIGTVTPRPQPGNERPRLFRLVPQRAIVNRMGFNNAGAAAVAERLRRLPPLPGPICVNVGRNKTTPNERAAEDYVEAFRALAPHAQLASINVSSPNTPGLARAPVRARRPGGPGDERRATRSRAACRCW